MNLFLSYMLKQSFSKISTGLWHMSYRGTRRKMGPVLSVAMASVPPTVTSTPPSSSATAVPRPRQSWTCGGCCPGWNSPIHTGREPEQNEMLCVQWGSVVLCPRFLCFMLAVVGVDSMNSIGSEMVVSTGQVVPAVSAVLLLLLELYTHTPWMIYEPSYFFCKVWLYINIVHIIYVLRIYGFEPHWAQENALRKSTPSQVEPDPWMRVDFGREVEIPKGTNFTLHEFHEFPAEFTDCSRFLSPLSVCGLAQIPLTLALARSLGSGAMRITCTVEIFLVDQCFL